MARELYQVELTELTGDQAPAVIAAFAGQDSRGTGWVDATDLTLDCASPVAVMAAEWLTTDIFPSTTEYYDEWEMKSLPE